MDVKAALYELASRHEDDMLPAELFRAVELQARHLSITEKFRDSLRADPLELGTARAGKLRRS